MQDSIRYPEPQENVLETWIPDHVRDGGGAV